MTKARKVLSPPRVILIQIKSNISLRLQEFALTTQYSRVAVGKLQFPWRDLAFIQALAVDTLMIPKGGALLVF